MRGLIVKEFTTLKKTGWSMLALIGIFCVMNRDAMILNIPMITIVLCILEANQLYTDEAFHWNSFSLALPVSRRDVVAAKYAVIAVTIAVMSVLCVLMSFILSALGMCDSSTGVLSLFVTLVGGFAYTSLVLPLFYKFDMGKGKMLLLGGNMVLAGTVSAMTVGATSSSDMLGFIERIPAAAIFAAAMVIALAMYGASFLIAAKIYEKRDI